MNNEKTIFSQLMSLVSRYDFNKIVKKYSKNYRARDFSYWDQFLTMSFAQVTFRESLRDIEACLNALGTKRYHLGIRSNINRSTLADANNKRDWRIWAELANTLIVQARKLYEKEPLDFAFKSSAYALDSSVITLCLTLFPWARYKLDQKGIKLHTQLDLRGSIPSFIHITQAKIADVKFLDQINIEAGALYVMDRGYFDFQRLFKFTLHNAFFVTRLKTNILYKRTQIYSRDRFNAIRCDSTIVPLNRSARKKYPYKLRLVEYYHQEQKKIFYFITNNFILSAQDIADIYRSRWKIELFFKWIKQHLRIKSFFGTSENAVKTQIWISVTVYTLVAILKKNLKLDQSLLEILQVLSVCSIDKNPIFKAFSDNSARKNTPPKDNQLDLFNFPTGH